MNNLNRGQILSIVIAVLGVLVASTSQLTDLVGPALTKDIVSISTLLMSVLSSIGAIISGQGSQIAAVNAMPGVEHIIVNEKANSTLATMAVSSDPSNSKIEATPQAQRAVEATARAAA